MIAPDVHRGTAGESYDPPPTDASPFEMVYVHVIPSTVSVSAEAASGRRRNAKRARRDFMVEEPRVGCGCGLGARKGAPPVVVPDGKKHTTRPFARASENLLSCERGVG